MGHGMNPTTPENNQFESTYAMLIRSEEKNRGTVETLVYLLLILSAVVSIWQFAHQSAALPSDKIANEIDREMTAQRG